MSKGFEAYRPEVVLDSFPRKAESMVWWNDYLLLGLQDASVLFMKRADTVSGTSNWQVLKAHRGLDRKAVLQMAAVRSRPLLLTLTDEGVQLYTLPDMQLKFQAMRSKGAACFAWNDDKSQLAAAVKRKVILFQLQGSDLNEVAEYNLPEAPVRLLWYGDLLWASTKHAYITINLATGIQTEVCSVGSAPAPCMAVAPTHELLLVRDSTSLFHTPMGKLSRRSHITWSEPVQGVEIRSLGRVAEKHVVQKVDIPDARIAAPAPDGSIFVAFGADRGVRRLIPVSVAERAHTLAELGEYQEALAMAALLDEDGSETYTTPKEDNGELSAQSSVASQVYKPPSAERQALEERLRIAYGHHLFAVGEYDEGMAQFALCPHADALMLLRLFPSLVPDKFRAYLPEEVASEKLPEVTEPAGREYEKAISLLLPYLLSHRTRNLNALQQASTTHGSQESAASQAQPHQINGVQPENHQSQTSDACLGSDAAAHPHQSHQPLSSSDFQQHSASSALPHPRVDEPTSHSQSGPPQIGRDGVVDSVPQPTDQGSSLAVSVDPGGNVHQTGHKETTSNGVVGIKTMLTIIDTAIVKVMIGMPDTGALLRFVQQPHHIDLAEAEKALTASGMYAELAALYKYYGHHESGLRLLQQLSQSPQQLPTAVRGAAADLPGLPGVWAAVRYLVSLNTDHISLIQRYSGWILAQDPEAGLQAFLQMQPPLDPRLVLSILHQHSAHYCGLYLEAALELGVALPQDYHSELLLFYLQEILTQVEPAADGASGAQPSLSQLLAHRQDAPPKLFPDDASSMSSAHDVPQWASSSRSHKQLERIKSSQPQRQAKSAPASSGNTPAASRIGSESNLQALAGPDKDVEHGGKAAAASASEAQKAAAPRTATPVPRGPTLYQRLRDLVYTSPYIDPEYVLSKLPQNQLLEIRALMLERLGRHREALALYVHGLQDLQLAEGYCDRVFEANRLAEQAAAQTGSNIHLLPTSPTRAKPGMTSPVAIGGLQPSIITGTLGQSPGYIYIELIEALLQGPDSTVHAHGMPGMALSAPTWQQLAWLLSRKRDRIDPLQILSLLPDDVALSHLAPFVEGTLKFCLETRRNTSVVRQLKRLENLVVREELAVAQQQRFLLTSERACSICHKRIGTAVFVAYPSQSLAHYLCYKRQSPQALALPEPSGRGPLVSAKLAGLGV